MTAEQRFSRVKYLVVYKIFSMKQLPNLTRWTCAGLSAAVHATGLHGASHTYVSGQLEYTTSGFMER